MAKMEYTQYLAFGAGAVIAPAIVSNVAALQGFLVGIPFWGQELFMGLTFGGIVLASLGVGIVDQLMNQ